MLPGAALLRLTARCWQPTQRLPRHRRKLFSGPQPCMPFNAKYPPIPLVKYARPIWLSLLMLADAAVLCRSDTSTTTTIPPGTQQNSVRWHQRAQPGKRALRDCPRLALKSCPDSAVFISTLLSLPTRNAGHAPACVGSAVSDSSSRISLSERPRRNHAVVIMWHLVEDKQGASQAHDGAQDRSTCCGGRRFKVCQPSEDSLTLGTRSGVT